MVKFWLHLLSRLKNKHIYFINNIEKLKELANKIFKCNKILDLDNFINNEIKIKQNSEILKDQLIFNIIPVNKDLYIDKNKFKNNFSSYMKKLFNFSLTNECETYKIQNNLELNKSDDSIISLPEIIPTNYGLFNPDVVHNIIYLIYILTNYKINWVNFPE